MEASNFPAGQENIDNIFEYIEEDPANLINLDKKGLADLYGIVESKIEDLENTRSAVKDQLFDMLDTDSEEVGNYLAIKVTKPEFKELTVEKARELGLTKMEEKIDTDLVKKAWKNGVDLGKVVFTKMNVMRRKKEDNG